jgi:hypothetical protein
MSTSSTGARNTIPRAVVGSVTVICITATYLAILYMTKKEPIPFLALCGIDLVAAGVATIADVMGVMKKIA